jgi:acetate kinase
MDSLLVINAGSSSVKFQLFAMDGPKDVERLVKGQIDGIGTHPRLRAALDLLEEERMSVADVKELLSRECGLKALSGSSSDVRDLEASSDPRAHFALDYFVYRAGLYAVLLAAALGGLDAFVFTGGIGENSPTPRARIAEKLGWLGCLLDPDANSKGQTSIAGSGSRVGLYMIPTDEE